MAADTITQLNKNYYVNTVLSEPSKPKMLEIPNITIKIPYEPTYYTCSTIEEEDDERDLSIDKELKEIFDSTSERSIQNELFTLTIPSQEKIISDKISIDSTITKKIKNEEEKTKIICLPPKKMAYVRTYTHRQRKVCVK
jgi:hypothetical protein